ncbi:Myc-type [Macleaya cordata]|uniref:Myc-type n=1 Tax=Macleaya cordata TaxID=56857 RepID=A0A200QEV6_MACCD|nr:Myc-type [Macleaya cordata]
MVSEVPAEMANEVNVVLKEPVCRSFSNKKKQGKVPKKIHKAEREKLKRDKLNDLFFELGNALEPNRQNNGKASILADATRLLQSLLAQVESHKKENASLLSESNYVTIEKNELRDENAIIEAEIEKLQTELQERILSEPNWNAAGLAQSQNKSSILQLPEDHPNLPVIDQPLQPPVVGPVLVIPLHDLHSFSEPGTAHTPPKPALSISRPHARYPTPSDSWPSQLLAKQQPKPSQELQLTR